jgi:hypothetical protein
LICSQNANVWGIANYESERVSYLLWAADTLPQILMHA